MSDSELDAVLPVSVIVPTIGRPRLLAACLQSLVDCRPSAADVLVVDQSIDAEIAEVVDGFRSHRVRRVACEVRGLGFAMNRGLQEATHDAVLVTHDDCLVQRDWVGEGWRSLSRDVDALVTGRVLPIGDPRFVPSCKADPKPRDYTGELHIDVLYPASMAVSRSAALALGGFDERFTSVAEDNDFCYRWLTAGRRLLYEPALVVWHGDWRTPAELRQLYRGYAYGSGLLYAKHLSRGDLRMLRFIARDLGAGLRGLLISLPRPERRGWDWRLGVWHGLPRGLVTGWRIERQLRRVTSGS